MDKILRSYRKEHHLTKREFAAVLEIHHLTLKRLEEGKGVRLETFVHVLGWLAENTTSTRDRSSMD